MLALSICCIAHLKGIITDVIVLVDAAVEHSEAGEWDAAAEKAEKALETWKKHDSFTHIVLNHNNIDTATGDIYNLLSEIYTQNPGGVAVMGAVARDSLEQISYSEQIRLGSIF